MARFNSVVLVAGCALCCAANAARAEDAQAVVANMRACGTEADDGRRLACYDKEFKASTGVSGRGADEPGAASAPTLTPEQQFGMDAALERKEHATSQPGGLDKLSGRIASLSRKLRGEAVITLDNGQVWEQTEMDTPPVPVKAGDTVSIRHGALGSFWLSVAGSRFRVKRVK